MFSKIPRPSRTAATIVAKLSSARIIAPACRVTSVPVMPIATPMSADFSAGASFTPSPVIATTSPSAWSASTIRSLCSGDTRANTDVRPHDVAPARRRPASSSSSPVAAGAPGSTMPRSAAIRSAVRGWSPVIIMTRMPARWAAATASAASGRAGSMIPTTPHHTSSRSSSASRTSPSTSSTASAAQLGPSPARRRGCAARRRTSPRPRRARRARRSVGRAGPRRAPTSTCVQRPRSTSGAPLVITVRPPSSCPVSTVDMSLRSDVNGTAATRRYRPSRSSWVPSLRSATRNAASVGSPCDGPVAGGVLPQHGVVRGAARRTRTAATSAHSAPVGSSARRPPRARPRPACSRRRPGSRRPTP